MATDLMGKPIGGHPELELSLQQKRQATLLYHWMSLEYLRGLKDMIDALIKGTDVTLALARRQGRDALIANERWGVRDTAMNWSTNVYPALQDFRRSTIKLIAWRAAESYCGTGANQCGRMISEHSSMWMTEEEEKRFKEQFESVYNYASKIDDAAGAGGARRLKDSTMAFEWQENASLFPRLPKFRVRTDVVGVTGKRPPRTGVYVCQDDEFATLQFAWIGNADGILGEAVTFNDLGWRLVAEVGRRDLWVDDTRLIPFALREIARDPTLDMGVYSADDIRKHPEWARYGMSIVAFTTRPCSWYFVEKIEGEYDDEPAAESPADAAQAAPRLRCEAGRPCPREGFWSTPALPNSRRRFNIGETLPEPGSGWGTTIWQWDDNQTP